MKLGFEATFDQLYTRAGLVTLDTKFIEELKQRDVALHNRLVSARAVKPVLKEESQLIIDLAPHLEEFIAELFGIRSEVTALKERHFTLAPLYSCKRLFVQRKAAKSVKPDEAAKLDGAALRAQLESLFKKQDALPAFDLPSDSHTVHPEGHMVETVFELTFSRNVMAWLDKAEQHADAIRIATEYAAWALLTPQGQEKHKAGILFKTPRKLDPLNLVAYETEVVDGVTVIKLDPHHRRAREGFALTDDGVTLAKGLDEANYCIWCHNQGKDSCSKGMKETNKETNTTSFKKNSLEITLAGCPLEEKISEMNFLKSEGIPLGALATVVIDNPMCAGTGHRICNDCMKACIYQKQEPVNIPQSETRTLMDVLELPYGFEIYSLLTRWNPLNLERPLPRPETGSKVLVAGMGPAGYTLAHHLLNDGHTVVGIDGLKIEPLPPEISGVTQTGERVAFAPVRDIRELFERLDERTLYGFGGVAEYGITVRWDKNFLKVIRLLLERRASFALIGGVRFGGTITIDSAWELGFDHIALCMGAGRPTVIDMPNGLARGVRTASDFLMALQLSGAAKMDSIANLQVRLPIVVIGGGLTAIDTATESLAYYPIQVEKFLSRYEVLVKDRGEQGARLGWGAEDTEIAEEFIAHAKAIREERKKPNPNVAGLLESWGGVKMVYRKRLIDAPSYRLNHEEVEKALEESIGIVENLEPVGVEVDKYGHAAAVKFKSQDGTLTIPARTVLMAAGTSPNTVLQREVPEKLTLHGKYFQAVDDEGKPVLPERVAKPETPQVLMAVEADGRALSFFGDLHPSFAGNVVKAMGSAKQGYPVVSRILKRRGKVAEPHSDAAFLAFMNLQLRATVHDVVRLTHNIVEVIVKAPQAAKQFEPGQFYRLQNFEMNALKVKGGTLPPSELRSDSPAGSSQSAPPRTHTPSYDTTLLMEGLALTGAWVDKGQGLLSAIVLEMGGSSNLCAYLKKGEPVVLMGPTGAPTEIPKNETVMLVGGGLGNAVLFSIGRAARENGCKVLYFAGYRKSTDRYKIEEIEKASDVIVWACDEQADFTPDRPNDKVFYGNIVQAIAAYAEGRLGETAIKTQAVDHIIAIGSDRMMAAVGAARRGILKPYLKPGHVAIGSINSPMQCMMKEICAQCIQQHVDPVTGATSYIYSCFNQDQALDNVSFPFLNERLRQNSLHEKLTAAWIDRLTRGQLDLVG
ncbi:MAG TPA: FAD-dependent oxidoreductase [Rickettsiales bacterium]|nr:FAD-dependent oxidoreductase [Rickettsiales bacterium]